MPIRPGAEPWSHDGDGTGVVLVHGFTGSPASMVPWGRRLAEQGWTVRVPRLPGHGTRWQEMNLTRWQDWYSEAHRAVEELRRRSDRVFVMGLSMGGALALRLAQEGGDSIAGLVLVNPAVLSERPDRHVLPVMRYVVPAFPGISNDINKPGQDEIAYDKIPLKAAYSMTQLWGAVKQDIGRVRQPLLLFRSADDHVVEPSNAAWILSNVASQDVVEVILERSAHVATLDYDAKIIEQGSIDFVRRIQS